ncbi:MAG: hypothetical protein K2N35_01320 [Muribaculaceae bacterium]|nr:hypothetical protein [Muribaculaceae bacterium]
MKTKFDINTIKVLLHKYYEAKTTPEEERIIESFFIDSRPEEIPKSLTEDQIIFSSLAELHQDSASPEIPEDLLKKVTSFAESPDNLYSNKSKWKWNRHSVWAVAAACVCLLTFGIRWLTAPGVQSPHLTEQAAPTQPHQSIMPPEENPRTNMISGPLKKENVTLSQKLLKENLRNETSNASVEDDGFIEITDPEEAEKIVLEISKLLAINSQKTNEALRNFEKTVDEYKEISKSILK